MLETLAWKLDFYLGKQYAGFEIMEVEWEPPEHWNAYPILYAVGFGTLPYG